MLCVQVESMINSVKLRLGFCEDLVNKLLTLCVCGNKNMVALPFNMVINHTFVSFLNFFSSIL